MRKLICLMLAVIALCALATVVSAEATVPTTCAAGCENPVWEPLPSGNLRLLDEGHYHYYLTKNDTTYRYTPNPNKEATSSDSANPVTICLDLNGYNITTDGRSLGVYSQCVLNIMDSSEAQTGYILGKAGNNNLVGGTFFNYGTINLYSGTLKYEDDGTGTNPTYAGGVMAVYENAAFNMYGGRLEGGSLRKVSGKNCHGGTIYSNGTVNIYAGEVISGSVQEGYYGPCIYNYGSGKVTISGSAKVDNIYAASTNAKVNVSGTFSGKARITLGYTPSSGKAIGTATNTPSITGDLFCTNGSGWLVNLSGSNLALATFTPSGARHYCEHCKDVVKWTSMTTSNYTVPKNTPGDYHYYLAANRSVYVQVGDGVNLCLDLYGKNLYRAGRVLLPNKGSQLNLMDTVGGGLVYSTGGTDNPRGGVITVSSGSVFNFYSGTLKFPDNSKSSTATGGIVAIGASTMNMYGGTIEGADLIKPTTGSVLGAAFYLFNANSILNIYGGTITSGTLPTGGTGACVYVIKGGQVTLSGDANVDNIRFASNDKKLIVEGIYSGTSTVTFPSSSSLILGAQVGVSNDAVVSGKITCTNGDYLVTPQDDKLVLSVNATAMIETESGRTNYATLQEAVDAYESGTIQMVRSVTEDVTVSKNVHLELNGKTVTGTITVAEGSTLYVQDAATDDYTVADGAYGKLTVSGNVAAETGYLMITEDGAVSFHKVELAIHTMTLRPDAAGIYYKSSFLGDEKVAAQVESYGVALSVIDIPYEKNINTKCVSSEFTGFESGASGNAGASTLLKGILKETNEEKINSRNLAMSIYGRPYIKTADGYIFGEPVSRDLQEQLEAADALTNGLTASQWYGLEDLYEKYAAVLANVNTPNIREGFQDDTLQLLMVGNSFCYYYVEELYGLLMANPDPNRGYDKVEIYNLYYSGCSLTQHLSWWQSGAANYQLYKTDANGRKEQTPASGTRWTLEDTLQLGRWDYISLQGKSSEVNYTDADMSVVISSIAEKAEPLLDRFHALHPEAQLLWHRTWPFEVGRISGSTTYTEELNAQYDAGMQMACDYMCNEFDKDKDYDLVMVNSGAAWPIAREENAKLETSLIPYGGLCARLGVANASTFVGAQNGQTNCGDGYHDGDIGGGQFLNACVWYETLTGQSCLENQYKPTGKYELADALAELLRNAAHSVVKAGE